MQWLEFTIQTAPSSIDLVTAELTMLGFDSFIIDDETDFHDFLDANRQYWDYVDESLEHAMQGLSQIRLYVEDGPQTPETVSFLRQQISLLPARYPAFDFGPLTVTMANVRDEDWENNWKQYYVPIEIGERLLVIPQWLHPEIPENRIPVILDPGMIFGTGAHASTQMCMRALERTVKDGDTVIDLGSGSGILSIAALRLGARYAVGVDIDPKAEDIARDNAAMNGLGSDVFCARTGNVLEDDTLMQELCQQGGDIVLANIVADVIIPLAPVVPHLMRKGGHFICSGVLNTRLAEVLQALQNSGLHITETHQLEDWCCVEATPD